MEEGPWTSQPSGGEMVKDDGIEMQTWRAKPHNHKKFYSSHTSPGIYVKCLTAAELHISC